MRKTPRMVPLTGLSTDESNTPPASLLGSRIKVIGQIEPDPYKQICDTVYALLSRKKTYYGCSEDPLANAMGVEEDGVDPATYQLARIGEKRRRLHGQLSKEDRIKTYLDIMGHAAVAVACLQRD